MNTIRHDQIQSTAMQSTESIEKVAGDALHQPRHQRPISYQRIGLETAEGLLSGR